eukprot:14157324-Alexandrium_andersonii.AAC.1
MSGASLRALARSLRRSARGRLRGVEPPACRRRTGVRAGDLIVEINGAVDPDATREQFLAQSLLC